MRELAPARLVHLVRHAHAGARRGWSGPDDLRPLSEKGHAQAAGLTRTLRTSGITQVISSPWLRCLQTVVGLAEYLHVPVEICPGVGEGAAAESAVDLLSGLAPGNVVVCSHGDVIQGVITRLGDAGAEIPDDPLWAKASIWVLDFGAGMAGRVTAKYLPPPE